jgi:hypothetical protein
MSSPAPLKTVLRKMQAHREACAASDDMAVQNTWAAIEDYLARLIAAGVEVEKDAWE